ncbi:nucleoside deaminase [Paramicrobacterium chengjingii]|uniref:Nucleoside deaminase n=1 Tax=Paramicrobacterium chengjingii TaxID=2769067 RepID=A0ABX6YGS1_9MICO|nr:nucleoside deaminase [Microbacterium chengjingii]QPZ37976.1 nucleoside deaminase [Microbacterium chengjingii]
MTFGTVDQSTRLLDVIECDIVPLTRKGVARGNKLFGAAILRRDDLSIVVAETNNEVKNPLWHGEIHAIKRFHELPAEQRPNSDDCVFLATHEPCSLCLSGIAWAGFTEFAYLFSHQDSADSFAIPHDIRILKAVYAVPDPDRVEPAPGRDLYNRENEFFSSHAIAGPPQLDERIARIAAIYDELSATYQRSKGSAGIPLA